MTKKSKSDSSIAERKRRCKFSWKLIEAASEFAQSNVCSALKRNEGISLNKEMNQDGTA